MTTPALESRIRHFYELLDDQVAEAELMEERGKQVLLFFDSKDIRYAIFGLLELFNGQRFLLDQFRSDAAMVQCLGFSGWLGQMNMLQPHQAELLAALKQPPALSIQKWDKFVVDFLHEVAYRREMPPIQGMSPRDLYRHVKRHAGSTYEAFKVFQYIVHASNWRARLKEMRDHGILELRNPGRVDADLVSSSEFRALKEILDKRRPRTTLNNFADAVALVLLIRSTQKFNAGESDSLWLYYDTTSKIGGTGFFQDVAAEAGLYDRLLYWCGERPHSVLKDAKYFRLRAMFRPSEGRNNEIYGSSGLRGRLGPGRLGLRKLRDEVGEILRAKELTEDVLVPSAGAPIRELIANIEDLSFFKSVWEDSLAEKDAKRVLEELNLAQLGAKEFREGVDGALSETLDLLESNTEEHRWISGVWMSLQERHGNLAGQGDFGQDFRLARFSLPSDGFTQAQKTLSSLSEGRVESAREAGLKAALQACHRLLRGRYVDPGNDYISELVLATSLLWLLEMYDDLIFLLSRQDQKHYSFCLVYSAAMIKRFKIDREKDRQGLGGKRKSIEDNLRFLDEKFFDAARLGDFVAQANLGVGLAYLHFEYWLSVGYWPIWRGGSLSLSKDLDEKFSRQLIEKAVMRSATSYSLLRDRSPFKAMYALNQRIFYLVEAGDDSTLPEVRMLVRDLLRSKQRHKECWQYTYSDTLARYNHRLAEMEADPAKRREHLKDAVSLAKAAVEQSRGRDAEIATYCDVLEAELAVG